VSGIHPEQGIFGAGKAFAGALMKNLFGNSDSQRSHKMGKHVLLILGLVVAFAATVRADVTVSDGSISNFVNAVSNIVATGGGTITVTKPITIGGTNDTLDEESFDGESVVTVSGGNTNAIFIVESGSLELANMTISGGLGKLGGAISISNGAAGTFTSCTFANNRAVGADGASAISNTNGGGNAVIGKNGARGTAGGAVAGGAIYSLGDLGFFECHFFSNSIVGGTGGDGGDGQSAGTRGGSGGGGGAGGTARGGAVCSLGATLVVSNCTFSGNSAEGGSGGVGGAGGGAIDSGVNGFAGAAGVASGGGLYTSSSNGVILNSTFDDNSTQGGDASTGGTNPSGFGQAGPKGGNGLGAGLVNAGTLSITNSTFYQNSATGGTGGDGGVGGVKGGAGGAGGSAIGGGIYNSGKILVVNCTFSKDDVTGGDSGVGGSGVAGGRNGKTGASFGGNIANVAKKKKTGFTLANSIIGEATSGKGGYGTIKDGGYNISADKSIKFKKKSTSLMNTNALDAGGDIADNSGPTETIALADDSPAVDLIPLDTTDVPFTPPSFDQRGIDRPIGNGFDVGAYELDPNRVTILSQPVSTNVILGSNAMFSVTVGGASPFFYQWFFNGAAVANQTNSSILITNAQTSEQGNFQVVITNSFNTATSRVAVLTVNQATNSLPVITQEPVLQLSVPIGSNATFSVTATSDTPLFYQWMFLPVGGTAGANVPNGTNATLLITNAQTSNQGQYQVAVSNQFGVTNSTIGTLFVTNATTDTNTTGIPPVPQVSAKANAKVKSSKHQSVSLNGEFVPDAESNRPARRQFIALGNSFPEPRRNVISPAPVVLAFNRRLNYS
jgi:hypothetical protein